MKNKINKIGKILMIFLFSILLIGSVSAFLETANFHQNENYGKVEIKRLFGLLGNVSTIELTYNTNSCFTNCSAEGTIVLYENQKLMDNIYFKNLKSGKDENLDYKIYVQSEIKKKEITIFDGYECINYTKWSDNNHSSYKVINCSGKKKIEYIEEPIWKLYEGEILTAGKYYWKIEGKKSASEKIDWQGVFQGIRVTDWAVWDGTIDLIYPLNNSGITNSNVSFVCNISAGTSLLSNGSLIIDGIRNKTFYGMNPNNIITDSIGLTFDSSDATASGGMIIIANVNSSLIAVGVKTTSNPTTFTLYDNSNNQLTTASFSGSTATLSSPYKLIKGTTYKLLATGMSHRDYISFSSYPINKTNINYTSGIENFPNPDGIHALVFINVTTINSTEVNITINTSAFGFTSGSHNWTCEGYDNSSSRGIAGNYTFSFSDFSITANSTYPKNDTNSTFSSFYFAVNHTISGGISGSITNATLILYNSTGDIYLTNFSSIISGNQSNLSLSGIPEGNNTWIYKICGMDSIISSCVYSGNKTYNLDSIAPIINLSQSNRTIDYHKLGNNLTFNWSISDPHLSSCNIFYEGNLYTPSCLDNNISLNITDINAKNINFSVNDTFGNYASINFSWNYKIFQNSIEYNNKTFSGLYEQFKLNITKDSSYTISSVNLFYNGTSNFLSFTNNINQLLIKNISIPNINANTNLSFKWIINFSDSSSVNSGDFNQSVFIINIDDCSAFTNIFLNLTLIDEVSQKNLDGKIESYISLNSFMGNNLYNFSNIFSGNNSKFCSNYNLNSSNYLLNSIIKYYEQNHTTEYYNILNLSMMNLNIPYNIYLYDLNNSLSTDFLITFKDKNFLKKENVLIYLQREYIAENNSFKTIELPKTDSNGQTSAHLVQKDIVYNIIAYDSTNGNVLAFLNNVVAFCEDATIGNCKININEESAINEIFNYNENIPIRYSNLNYNDTSRILSTTFFTSDGSIKNVQMMVFKSDYFGNITACNNSIYSSSGTLSCTIPSSIGNSTLDIKFYVDGDLVIQDYKSTDSSTYGDSGYFILLLMIILLSFLFIDSKTIQLIVTALIFVSGIGLSLIKGTIIGLTSGILSFIIAIIILAWKVNKEGDS